MKSFITDENNDLTLDKWGNIRLEDGVEAYRQHIINVIRLQQYEYPYDLMRGINWIGYVFGQTANLTVWESQLFEVISKMSFIKNILDWKYNIEGNVLQFNLVVNTDLGEITIRG
jgi:hypothetical protein